MLLPGQAEHALHREPCVEKGWAPMATTVFPSTLTFNRGLSLAPQVRAVTITGQNVTAPVADSPPGGTFGWRGSPPQGWLLTPPPELPAVIPVTFTPSSMAPVQAIMT